MGDNLCVGLCGHAQHLPSFDRKEEVSGFVMVVGVVTVDFQ